jgi:hypothetical protein
LEEEMTQIADSPGVSGIVVPHNSPVMTPEEAAKGRETVLMIFDNPVLLTMNTNQKVHYPKGIHEVPVAYVNHWYLEAHGVRPVPARSMPSTAAAPAPAQMPAKQKPAPAPAAKGK